MAGLATAQSLGMAYLNENMDPRLDYRVQNGTHVFNCEMRHVIEIEYAAIIEEQAAACREAATLNPEHTDEDKPAAGDDDDLLSDDCAPAPLALASRPFTPPVTKALIIRELPVGESQARLLDQEQPWESQYVDRSQGNKPYTLRK